MAGLTIGGGEPMPDEGAPAPEAGAGPLALEAMWKACKAGDFAGAYESFKDALMAADDEMGGEEEPEAEMPPL